MDDETVTPTPTTGSDDGRLLEQAADALLGTILLAADAAREVLDPEADGRDRDGDGSPADALVGLAAAVNRRAARAVAGTAGAAGSAARWVVDESPLSGPARRTLEPLTTGGQQERRTTTDAAGRIVSELARRIASEIVEIIDVNAIVQQVDVDAVVKRVDVEDIISRVDIDAIVGRTEIGRLVVESTGGVAGEMLDVVRSQAVGLDRVVTGVTNRLLRRQAGDAPDGPSLLVPGNGDGSQ